MKSYYHHKSMRINKSYSSNRFMAMVEEFIPIAFKLNYEADDEHDPDDVYGIHLPHGSTMSAWPSKEEALKSAHDYLAKDGWVLDRDVAKQRADKETELRESGKLRFAGPKFSQEKFDACQHEIMAIT